MAANDGEEDVIVPPPDLQGMWCTYFSHTVAQGRRASTRPRLHARTPHARSQPHAVDDSLSGSSQKLATGIVVSLLESGERIAIPPTQEKQHRFV